MKRILVAYDGGEAARSALDTAIDLAKKFDGVISVVSVVPFYPGRAPVDPWDDHAIHADELLEARAILAAAGIEADLLEPIGDPARTIERIAADGGFDIVVLGSRGRPVRPRDDRAHARHRRQPGAAARGPDRPGAHRWASRLRSPEGRQRRPQRA